MSNFNLFLSTRQNKKLYKFLINSTKNNAELILGQELEIVYFKQKKFPSINFIIFLILTILNGAFFFNKKFINLKYSSYQIGRYVLSHCMRKGGFYSNKFNFWYLKFKFLIVAGKLLNSLDQINDSVKAAYIDHGMYINGILLQVAIKKRILIYSNGYPKGIFCYDFRSSRKKKLNMQYEDFIKLKPRNINHKQLIATKKALKKICCYKELYPWMLKAKFLQFKKKIDLKKFTHVIYTHSFLEVRYIFGNDGFLGYEDWLEFTIKELVKNKDNYILVKAHPNFYTNNFTDHNYIDLEIFQKIKNKFKNELNLYFMDYSYKNYDLLTKLNKKTIVVARHSNALMEAIYFGFKVIFSSAVTWDVDYLRSDNCWKNKDDYSVLLRKDWTKLYFFSKTLFYRLSYDFFCNPKHSFGKDLWVNIISDYYKIPYTELEKKTSTAIQKDQNFNKLINKISSRSIFYEKVL